MEETQTKQEKSTVNKVLSFIIGDLEKWKHLDLIMKNLWEDIKEDSKDWRRLAYMIILFAVGVSVSLGVMYLIYIGQYSSQYCQIQPNENIAYCSMYGTKIDFMYDNNKSYMYLLNKYKNKTNAFVCMDIYCKFDIKRYLNEVFE